MFALFAFGYLFGFVGLLLAVPLAAASGVLIRFALAIVAGIVVFGQFMEGNVLAPKLVGKSVGLHASPLYTGNQPP
jgi:predicted PurR-regulated permease PerM